MQQQQLPKQEPEDLTDFLASLQVGAKKNQTQQQPRAKPNTKPDKPKQTRAVKGDHSDVEIAPSVLDFFAQAAGSAASAIPPTTKTAAAPASAAQQQSASGTGATTSFVPLQVSMKSAKDQRPVNSGKGAAGNQEAIMTDSKPSKMEAWVGQTLTQQSAKPQQKKSPRRKDQQNKSKKRLAANFGGGGGNPEN